MRGSSRCLTQRAPFGSTYGGELLLFTGTGNREAGDRLPQLLAGGDVADCDVAGLLEIEERQSFGEQLAIDNALAEAGDNPEPHAPRKLVHCRADTFQIVRFDMLQAVSEDHPIDTLAGRLRALSTAVPDQLGIETWPSDLVILGMDLADEVEINETVVHRRDQSVGLEDRRAGNRIVAPRRVDHDHVGILAEPGECGGQ